MFISLEEGMATHSSILAWKIPWTQWALQATVHGVAESDTTEATEHTHVFIYMNRSPCIADRKFTFFSIVHFLYYFMKISD